MTSQDPTILHVIDTTGPGGAETVFIQLANACQQSGTNSIALIRGPGWVADQLAKLSVRTVVLDCKGSFNIGYLRQLIDLIRTERITTIQSHLLGSNVYCSLAGILTRTPVISTFHGHVDISPTERFRTAKFWLIAKGSKAVVAVTEDLLNGIRAMGNKALTKASVVIPNGIDTSTLIDLPIKPLPLLGERIVFGSLGNIRKAKNYLLAVDFIEALVSQGADAHLIIAGDDSKVLADELRAHIASKKLESRITLLGFIDDVPEFFSSIDVFLMTSSSEGHPLALTQALAAAVPILTTPSGVEAIVTHTESAVVSIEHTALALIEAFGTYVKLDEATKTGIIEVGRKLAVEKYSLDAMCEGYFSRYGVIK